MDIVRYRFNRKVGQIYLEYNQELISIGKEMKVTILWASNPVFGKPFPHLPAQNWVQLTFLDIDANWCYALLNSGTTNALYPWIEYRRQIESKSRELYEIVTTIGFEPTDSDNQWFDYKFSGTLNKLAGEIARSLLEPSQFPLIDTSIKLLA